MLSMITNTIVFIYMCTMYTVLMDLYPEVRTFFVSILNKLKLDPHFKDIRNGCVKGTTTLKATHGS